MNAGYSGETGREHTDLSKRNMSYQVNSAYANALLYYYSGGKPAYAENAVRILNAYAHTFKGFVSTDANSHVGDLFAAWMSQILVRAAEIVRYTYKPGPGMAALDVRAFESMLREAFVPRLEDGTAHVNNWRTSAAEGLMNIGVFLDDRQIYNRAIEIWREVTPSYIYLSSDGLRPGSLSVGTEAQLDCLWVNNSSPECHTSPKSRPGLIYQNGQSQETCRDIWHASAGLGGIINAAETAFLQGDNLYGEERDRITTGLSYMLQLSQSIRKDRYPKDFCAGAKAYPERATEGEALSKNWDSTTPLPAVVALNHYTDRQGMMFSAVRIPGYPDGSPSYNPVREYVNMLVADSPDTYGYVTSWQVLTHHDVGVGVPPGAAMFVPPSARPSSAEVERPSAAQGPKAASPAPIGLTLGFACVLISIAGILVLLHSRNRAQRRRPRRSEIRPGQGEHSR